MLKYSAWCNTIYWLYTNPKIPDSDISIMACCKNMLIDSVPFDLWGTNWNGVWIIILKRIAIKIVQFHVCRPVDNKNKISWQFDDYKYVVPYYTVLNL